MSDKIRPLSQKLSAGLSKLHSTCPQEHFEEFFFGKSTISSLSDVVGELFDLFRKSMGGVVKLCNYVSVETFRGKKVFSQQNEVFQKKQGLREKFSVIVEKFSTGLPKLHSDCPLGTFSRKILFVWKNLFHLNFANRSRKFLLLLNFFYGGVVKITFYVSIGKFWGLYFFQFPFFFFISGHWLKNFLHFLKKMFQVSMGKNGVNLFNWSTVLLILFGNWAKSLGPLTKVLWRSFENYILRVHQGNLRALFQKK